MDIAYIVFKLTGLQEYVFLTRKNLPFNFGDIVKRAKLNTIS